MQCERLLVVLWLSTRSTTFILEYSRKFEGLSIEGWWCAFVEPTESCSHSQSPASREEKVRNQSQTKTVGCEQKRSMWNRTRNHHGFSRFRKNEESETGADPLLVEIHPRDFSSLLIHIVALHHRIIIILCGSKDPLRKSARTRKNNNA